MEAHETSTASYLFYSLAAVIGGIGNAASVTLGATLTPYTGNGIRSACVNFLVASILLYTLVVLKREWRVLGPSSRGGRERCLTLFGTLPWYIMLVPGLIGATVVGGSVVLLGFLEYATYSVFVLAGQFSVSSLIDHFGIRGTPRDPMTLMKGTSIVVLIFGAMCVQGMFEQMMRGSFDLSSLGLALIAAALGALNPTQALFNRNAASAYNSPLLATTVSFSFGLIFLFIGASLAIVVDDRFRGFTLDHTQWFNWFGGIGGTFYVNTQSLCPKVLGTGLFFACIVFGQLLVAVLLDATQFLPGAKTRELTPLRIVGVVIVFFGVVTLQVIKTLSTKKITNCQQFRSWLFDKPSSEVDEEITVQLSSVDQGDGSRVEDLLVLRDFSHRFDI